MTHPPSPAERWSRITELLGDLVELPTEARRDALVAATDNDLAMREELESLLQSLESGADRFDSPPRFRTTGEVLLGTPVDRSGQVVGPYTLVRTIGSGGMGDVYEAVRASDDFTKRVALKMIHSARSSELLARRFRQERRILARLDHRNIAALVDGGVTEDGRPYYAMELVDGQPLLTWCASQHADIRERVNLFRQVCNAVDYAHRNLVVHRDLKPGNIFVTRDGTVKLLDFGVAKMLAPDDATGGDETEGGFQALTPAYASPEQLRHEPVTTASDVFALGIVLFELLTGRHPFRSHGPSAAAMRERLLAGDAPAPSSLAASNARTLRGDLDTIVLTALRPEPDRRYRSAIALGEDLRRWTIGLPILARPDSIAYRARKFVARHLAATLASTAGLVAIVVGAFTTLHQANVARLERDRARAEAEKASELTAFMEQMLRSADPRVSGRDVTVAEALDSAAARADRDFASRPEVQAAVQTSIGLTYLGIGRLDEGLGILQAALATRERLGDRTRGDVPASLYNVARALDERGDVTAAETFFRRALAAYRTQQPVDSLELAHVLNDLGDVLQYSGKLDEALVTQREALAIRRAVTTTPPEELAASLNNVGVIIGQQGQMAEAEPLLREALQVVLRAKGPDHPDVASALNALAFTLNEQGKVPPADSLYREALRIRIATLGVDHPEVTRTLNQYGWLQHDRGAFDSAAVLARSVLARRDHSLPSTHPMIASSLVLLGQSLLALGKTAEAERHLRDALALRRQQLPADHWLIAVTKSVLGESVLAQGRRAEAAPLLNEGFEGLRTGRGADHPLTRRARARLEKLR
jgi:serine/threonine-protein kinase